MTIELTNPSTTIHPYKKPTCQELTVDQLHPTQYKTVIAIANHWSLMAHEERKKLALTDPKQNRLKDCENICWLMSENFDLYEGTSDVEIFICSDKQRRPQAMMTLSATEDTLEILKLVTNPWNISSSEPQKAFPVKGAGKALVREAINMAVELNKNTLSLSAYPGAKSFYESLGFKQTGKESEAGNIRMFLTAKRTNDLCNKIKTDLAA